MSQLVLLDHLIFMERYKWVGENSQAIPMLLKKVLDKQNPIIIWGSGNQKKIIFMLKIVQNL